MQGDGWAGEYPANAIAQIVSGDRSRERKGWQLGKGRTPCTTPAAYVPTAAAAGLLLPPPPPPVAEHTEFRPTDETTRIINCPPSAVGHIIGLGGEGHRAVQKQTGCRVWIHKDVIYAIQIQVRTSIHLSLHISVRMSIHMQACMYVRMTAHMSMYTFMHILIHMSIHISVSIHVSAQNSVHVAVPMSTHTHAGTHVSIYRSTHVCAQFYTRVCAHVSTCVYKCWYTYRCTWPQHMCIPMPEHLSIHTFICISVLVSTPIPTPMSIHMSIHKLNPHTVAAFMLSSRCVFFSFHSLHTSLRTCPYTLCTHKHVCIHVYVPGRTHVCTHVYTHVYTRVCTHVCTYVYMFIHMSIHYLGQHNLRQTLLMPKLFRPAV